LYYSDAVDAAKRVISFHPEWLMEDDLISCFSYWARNDEECQAAWYWWMNFMDWTVGRHPEMVTALQLWAHSLRDFSLVLSAAFEELAPSRYRFEGEQENY
jgi:hypothetical protein